MGTKAKGLFKGLRYISQIFDDNKESEMQIGLPTDVKHVAHIGWDGPSSGSPSWMKGFESPTPSGTHPTSPMNLGEPNNSCEWATEDSRRGLKATTRDQPDLPKSSRRVSLKDKSESVERPRTSRRHHLKDSVSTRISRDESISATDSAIIDDVAKKSRRRKPRDPASSSRPSRTRNRGSGSGSGSSYASCTDLDSSVTSTYSNKDDKDSIEAC